MAENCPDCGKPHPPHLPLAHAMLGAGMLAFVSEPGLLPGLRSGFVAAREARSMIDRGLWPRHSCGSPCTLHMLFDYLTCNRCQRACLRHEMSYVPGARP